jgi:hypothetical protein
VFWYIVISGLKVLTYWETYAAMIEYIAIFYAAAFIVNTLTRKNRMSVAAAGRISLLLPVLQACALLVFVLSLAPIIFGVAEDAAWSYPLEIITAATGRFFTLIGILIVFSGMMAIIPLLRRLPALQSFVLGVIALMFCFGIFITENPGILKGPIAVIPDIWIITGLLAIVSVTSWAGRRTAAFAGRMSGIEEKGPGKIILFPLSAVFGLLPVFMYGAFLGVQLRGGF